MRQHLVHDCSHGFTSKDFMWEICDDVSIGKAFGKHFDGSLEGY